MFLTIESARLPCCTTLSRLPCSISAISLISARSFVSRLAPASASRNSSISSTETAEKLLTKLSGFLISCAMPAVSWPSAAIFCAWNRLACAVCKSREAAAGHRVTSHFDDTAVGARSFETHLPAGIFDGAAQFSFEIGRVLAALREIAEILGIVRPRRAEGVRQIKHLLEIAVPRGKSRRGVEHDDAIAHIVEGDAKLGLAVVQLTQEPRILDGDRCLISKGSCQLDFSVRKRIDPRSTNNKNANQRVLAQKWQSKRRADAGHPLSFRIGVVRIRKDIGNVDRSTLQSYSAGRRSAVRRKGMRFDIGLSFLRL